MDGWMEVGEIRKESINGRKKDKRENERMKELMNK